MTRLTLSVFLFAFIAVISVSAPDAPAQGHGLIQDDYDQYAQLFKTETRTGIGREPNFTTSESWRRKYARHLWAEYAEGDEYRDPMLAAQVLTGIYLVQHVDHRLTYQIENIILGKAAMSSVLAERITLDEIANYLSDLAIPQKEQDRTELRASFTSSGSRGSSSLTSGLSSGGSSSLGSSGIGGIGGIGGSSGSSGNITSRDFYSDLELDRMYALNRSVDAYARQKVISGPFINRGQRIEIRSIQNLFDHSEKGWVATYYFMREKFDILNELADSFTFNWDAEKREAEIEKMLADPKKKQEFE